MESRRAAIFVKVCDLDGCRSFYRELLGLGDPVADSSFMTEFSINGQLTLVLLKSEAPFLEHASAATSWMLECANARQIWDRIADADYHTGNLTLPEGEFLTIEDPEGNQILLKEKEA